MSIFDDLRIWWKADTTEDGRVDLSDSQQDYDLELPVAGTYTDGVFGKKVSYLGATETPYLSHRGEITPGNSDHTFAALVTLEPNTATSQGLRKVFQSANNMMGLTNNTVAGFKVNKPFYYVQGFRASPSGFGNFAAVYGPNLAADNLTDTAGTDLASHTGEFATWTRLNTGNGRFVIAVPDPFTDSHGVRHSATDAAGETVYVMNCTPPSADYFVQGTIAQTGTPLAQSDGIAIRVVDKDNFYAAGFKAQGGSGNGKWTLWKCVNGTVTQLAEWDFLTFLASPNMVKIEAIGNEIKVYVGGTLRISVTDSDITDAGKPGIVGLGGTTSTSVGYYIDKVQAGTFLLPDDDEDSHLLIGWIDTTSGFTYCQFDDEPLMSSEYTLVASGTGSARSIETQSLFLQGTDSPFGAFVPTSSVQCMAGPDGVQVEQWCYWSRKLTAQERADLYNEGAFLHYDPETGFDHETLNDGLVSVVPYNNSGKELINGWAMGEPAPVDGLLNGASRGDCKWLKTPLTGDLIPGNRAFTWAGVNKIREGAGEPFVMLDDSEDQEYYVSLTEIGEGTARLTFYFRANDEYNGVDVDFETDYETWHKWRVWADPVTEKMYAQVDDGEIEENDAPAPFLPAEFSEELQVGYGATWDNLALWFRTLTNDEWENFPENMTEGEEPEPGPAFLYPAMLAMTGCGYATPIVRAGGAQPVLLGPGIYTRDADEDTPPYEELGWVLTTNLGDGSIGDVSTRETSTGAKKAVLVIEASEGARTGVSMTARWLGDIGIGYSYWDGSAYEVDAPDTETTPTSHGDYADDTIEAEWVTPTASAIRRYVFTVSDTTDNSFASVSDIRETLA